MGSLLWMVGLGSVHVAAQESGINYNPISQCYESAGGLGQFCPKGPGPQPHAAPPKPDVWGALAVSASTLASGTSWNYKSEAAASESALSECRTRGGGDCKVVKTVADVCLALAVSNAEKVFAVGGPTGAGNFADAAALLKCQRAGGKACFVQASFCADGERHELRGQTVYANGNPVFVPDGPHPKVASASRPSPLSGDTARFFGTWTAEITANGQTVTLLSVHDTQGYRNFVLTETGSLPAGTGTFSAAHGKYQTSAPKPNDAGTYRFLDGATVICTNAAGQTATWKRQGKPAETDRAPVRK